MKSNKNYDFHATTGLPNSQKLYCKKVLKYYKSFYKAEL